MMPAAGESERTEDRWIKRLGFGRFPAGPSIWVHGEDAQAFEAAAPLLERLANEHPRYRLAFTAPGRALRQSIRDRWPSSLAIGPPVGSDLVLWRFFGKLRPHLLIVLEQARHLPASVYARAHRYPFPVVALESSRPIDPAQRGTRALLLASDRAILRSPNHGARLIERGLSPAAVFVLPDGSIETRARAFADATASCPRWDTRPGSRRPSVPVRALRALVDSPPVRRVLHRNARRIESLAELSRALGNPRTILCLGNGPSSADPRLSTIGFDSLFRVNHRWLADSRLTQADMVFTAGVDSAVAANSAILAFRTIDEERSVLTRMAFRPGAPRLAYVTLERLPVTINEVRWQGRPTNGAAMISLGAALKPDRLIIAGIDLYEHPDGIYPDEPGTPNAYYIVHNRAVDVGVIRRALDTYGGSVTMLNETLQQHLDGAAGGDA